MKISEVISSLSSVKESAGDVDLVLVIKDKSGKLLISRKVKVEFWPIYPYFGVIIAGEQE